jgi:hypothetical protein
VRGDRADEERRLCECGRPLRQGEARCPNCRWRAAARWKVPLTWLARTAGAIASMMIVVFFTKGRAKPSG